MRNKFWDYSYWFLSGYIMNIILTEKMTVLRGVWLATFILVISSEFYLSYAKRKAKKS